MSRNLFAAVVVLGFAGATAAQPDPKKPDPLVTKVYDLKPILGEKGKASGIADADAVIKLILDHLPVGELKPGTDGPQIVERDGRTLVVRVPAAVQREVADLLEAVKRLGDLAVDVKAEVVELDAAALDKLAKALPKDGRGKVGSPVLFATGEEAEEKAPAAAKALAEVNELLAAGRLVQKSDARFVNGAEATVSARHAVVTFHPQVVNQKPEGPPQFVKEGFKLVGLPVVSADRRFVRFKLTEQSVAVSGMKVRELGELNGRKLVAQSPELEDLGASGSAVVADGGTLLYRLAYAPKGKVWVVLLRPSIFVREEEDAARLRWLKRLGIK